MPCTPTVSASSPSPPRAQREPGTMTNREGRIHNQGAALPHTQGTTHSPVRTRHERARQRGTNTPPCTRHPGHRLTRHRITRNVCASRVRTGTRSKGQPRPSTKRRHHIRPLSRDTGSTARTMVSPHSQTASAPASASTLQSARSVPSTPRGTEPHQCTHHQPRPHDRATPATTGTSPTAAPQTTLPPGPRPGPKRPTGIASAN